MSDDLHETDVVTWSRLQADRLRRHAAGERVNDVDWAHVIEEIEDVGSNKRDAVVSLLYRAAEHALKLAGWPEDPAVRHWRSEALAFLTRAQRQHLPSMDRTIDLAEIYEDARKDVLAAYGAPPGGTLPEACALSLAELMDRKADRLALIERLGRDAAD